MKVLGRHKAFERLRKLKDDFRHAIALYERKASLCGDCVTPGACCLDAHFVNVRISTLEAESIKDVIGELPAMKKAAMLMRIEDAIERFKLREDPSRTYACPLYERGVGCLIHDSGTKPLPCIAHACYENREDLPPDALLEKAEHEVDMLNTRVYGRPSALMPLPVAVSNAAK